MSCSAADSLSDGDAIRAADVLSQIEEVVAVCVAGSSARGDFGCSSDIDLLGLVCNREAAIRARRSFVGLRPRSRRVELKLLSEARLKLLFERRSTFAVHVLREGVIAYDPDQKLAQLFAPYSRDEPVRNNQSDLLLRIEPYEDLSWCQGLYLYALADFYSVGRAAAFTILGREARFEFSAQRAFRAVTSLRPELAEQVALVEALRPFFLLAERDEEVALPFAYRDSHDEAMRARNACRALASAIR